MLFFLGFFVLSSHSALSPQRSALNGTVFTRARYVMGTVCEIEAHGQNRSAVSRAIDQAFEEIARLEDMMSSFKPSSEVCRLEREASGSPVKCSPELFEVLALAERVRLETDGAFDVTFRSVVKIQNPKSKIQNLILDRVHYTVRLDQPGVRIDLGGIGKGYALDRAGRVLLAEGATGARLNFGGHILVVGKAPRSEGWEIRLAGPDGTPRTSCWLTRGSMSTSSNAERPHVVDPFSGKPVAWRGSVTVTAPTAVEADALSTALLVMGRSAGERWAESRKALTVVFQESEERRLAANPQQGIRSQGTPSRGKEE